MTCSGSPGSPAPAEGSHSGWCWLGSVVSEPLQRCPKHTLRRSSWTLGSPWLCSVPMLLQEGARLDLFDHADLTCTLCPTAAFLTSSYLLEKKFCFSCKSGGNFFFFFNHLSSFGINPQTLVFFLQGEEGGAGWAFIPAGSCQTGLHAGQPQCSLAVSLLHTLPQTVRTSLSWVPALPVPPFLC